ncbi:lysosomal alpha-mannosidase isoform X1 [Cephus cinctus]|uniref:Alpha-mannosidase n=1 Tax=Cephus cinctus TaxID=211228 RepID=A0AAJ7BMJ9_CEPCN|nr:lysosomal alpha-mannosidase isoform X1 [Cephus cinctus]
MKPNIISFLLGVLFIQIFLHENSARVQRKRKEKTPTCGYQTCPKVDSEKLNIHLVPHTHDDVGWLKTVDQYYFGSRSSVQKAGVQYILDTVVQELLKDPSRRFIYVETAFLWKWWSNQDETVRDQVRSLINQGRLEIISGGWSMNDEAVTHYNSIIDQFSWGLRRLNDTFGSCARPHIGWQIDPFGHSREQASIFAQMGFDGLFFGRLDYQDKTKRLNDKTAEFIWKASPNLGEKADLFTNVLYNNYSPPPGFCFDVLCDDEPMIDDPESPDNNIDTRIDSFLQFADKQAEHYRTKNIIMTMGGDFTYQAAQMWYKNLDKFIRYTTERNGSTVNVFYSTPSCYLKAVNDLNLTWPTKTDDFFPYASDPNAYWTGYFTSRPTIKFFERIGNNFLQVCKQLSVLANLQSVDKNLEEFREAMGIMQHHDAVTGTEKQKVANDYARILYKNMYQGDDIVSSSLSKWILKNKNENSSPVQFHSCLELNISSCTYTEENTNFVVTLYNPQSQPVTTYVRLPVQGQSYSVKDSTGTEQKTQIVPIPTPVINIPGRKSKATVELVFAAIKIPALGYQSYYISENNAAQHVHLSHATINSSMDSALFNITVNGNGNVIVQDKHQDIEYTQSFHYYEGAEGNNKVFLNRSSGAYIFRPKTSDIKNLTNTGSHKIYKGPLVDEMHITINDWISQVVRVYNKENFLEFNWLVGPIPVGEHIGKEVITKYSSNLKTNKIFYTDSNGREMIKRIRDFRPTWDVKIAEPVSGNYYPVTSKIFINDKKRSLKLSVLTDRSEGGTSLRDGEIELMVHRRLLSDDAFGVGEPLNEEAFGTGLETRGQHYVIGGRASDVSSIVLKEKKLAQKLALRPWTFITPVEDITFEQWSDAYNMEYSGISKAIPANIHILTLEPWKSNSILLRLEHIFEIGEDPRYSQPTEINIQDLFSTFRIVSVRETTLGGNQWISELNRLKWNVESNNIINNQSNYVQEINQDGAINVLLKPMEIRTFIVEVAAK